MAKVKPFKGLRPPVHLVELVESRPYDVLNSEEARIESGQNNKSLYHIIKPEINFPSGTCEYDACVYNSAVEQFKLFQQKGWLKQDEQENYYLYAQTMNGKTQFGFVVCVSVDDYFNNIIRKHELTRRDKEEDRMKHVRNTNANMEPVFLAYRHSDVLADMIFKYSVTSPEYDFIAPIDNFRHQFWVISSSDDQKKITEAFDKIETLYIADGHHRSAAAALVGAEKAKNNPHNTGKEEYNFFMAVCFPAEQLTVLDYNRVIKDLNGLSSGDFLKALAQKFKLTDMGLEIYKPQEKHEFALYLDSHWYSLKAKEGIYEVNHPIASLDVDISTRFILNDILDIQDLRSSNRIDFVGGIRGLEELKRRVDSGEMRCALALYPVSMDEIMNVADTGNIMPPKATWFEPKLRSGLVIHKLD